MKKQQFNFKDLKGALTREEMRSVKGGTGIICGNRCPTGFTQAQCIAYCYVLHSGPGDWCGIDPNNSSAYCYCEAGDC